MIGCIWRCFIRTTNKEFHNRTVFVELILHGNQQSSFYWQERRYCDYTRGDFDFWGFFAPQGWHDAQIIAKFNVKKGTQGSLHHAKYFIYLFIY